MKVLGSNLLVYVISTTNQYNVVAKGKIFKNSKFNNEEFSKGSIILFNPKRAIVYSEDDREVFISIRDVLAILK